MSLIFFLSGSMDIIITNPVIIRPNINRIKKNILILLFALLVSLFSGYSVDFYNQLEFSYEDETPNDIYVTGGKNIPKPA